MAGVEKMDYSMHLWSKITHLGDTSLMAPAALLIGLWLLASARRDLLWRWIQLLAFALALVALSKIAFIGWGIGIPALDFTGLSGHSTFATAVLPVMAYLLLHRYPGPVRIAGVALGLAMGLLVGISRLVLSFHSSAEVIAGCVLGALVSLGFIWVVDTARRPTVSRSLIVASLVALLAASSLQAAPTQYWFIRVALYMSGHDRPFVRTRSAQFSDSGAAPLRQKLFCFARPEPRLGITSKNRNFDSN
jgi:hypothetical protein